MAAASNPRDDWSPPQPFGRLEMHNPWNQLLCDLEVLIVGPTSVMADSRAVFVPVIAIDVESKELVALVCHAWGAHQLFTQTAVISWGAKLVPTVNRLASECRRRGYDIVLDDRPEITVSLAAGAVYRQRRLADEAIADIDPMSLFRPISLAVC